MTSKLPAHFRIPSSIKLLFRKNNGPTIWQYFRETVGEAVRETGQALDRLGLQLESFARLPDKYVGQDPPCIYQDHLSRHRTQMPLLHCGKPIVSPDVAFIAPCATLIGNVHVQAGASIWYGAILRGDTCLNANSFRKTDEELLAQLEDVRIGNGDPLLLVSNDYTPPPPPTKTDDDNEQLTETTIATAKDPTTTTTSDNVAAATTADNDFGIKSGLDERADGYENGGGIYVGVDTNLQDGVIVTARKGSTVLGQGVTVGHLAQIHSATVDDFALIGMGSILSEGVHVETEALIAAGAVVAAGTRVKSGELWVGQPARKIRDLTHEQRAKLHYQSSEYVKVALTQQHVAELGGNLPPEYTLLGAVQYNMENDDLFEEPMADRIARNNRWARTIYKEYVLPDKPKDHTALGAGEGEAPTLSSSSETTQQQLSAAAVEERNKTTEQEETKSESKEQPLEPETTSAATTKAESR